MSTETKLELVFESLQTLARLSIQMLFEVRKKIKLLMDIEKIENCVGQHGGQDSVVELLKSFGVLSKPKLSGGKTDACEATPKHGVDLTFTLESEIAGASSYPESALALVNACFYGVATSEFTPYFSELPLGQTFGLSKDALFKRLDSPSGTNESSRRFRWNEPYRRLMLVSNEGDLLELCSIQFVPIP